MPRRIRVGFVLVLAAAVLSVYQPARAQLRSVSNALVIVTATNPDAPLVRRLAAELSLFGYRVDVATLAPDDGQPSEMLLCSRGAALIAVDESAKTAELVVCERPGTGPAVREVERLDPRRRPDINAVVLAERSRARLTELGLAPGPTLASAPPLAAPAPERAQRRPGAAERWLWLVGALGASTGGLGALPEVELELRAFPLRWLSTSAFAKWSPLGAQVSAREGQVDVRLLTGGALIDVYPTRGPLSLKLGLGATLVNVSMSGRAAAPWEGREDVVLVSAAIFRSGAALRLSPRVSAELHGFVGVCSARVGVRVAGETVARYGQPFLGASLGLAVGLF